MLPLFTAEQIRRWDAYTISHEPISSIHLMERASHAFVNKLLDDEPNPTRVLVFCGSGNNGGDGLAISRILLDKKMNVETYYVESAGYSEDFQTNLERLKKISNPHSLISEKEFPNIDRKTLIIDALLGTGLRNEPHGIYPELIKHINQSEAKVVSVDIPSGLPCETIPHWISVIRASLTISFQIPKRAFLLAENEQYTGKVVCTDIGLHPDFLKTELAGHYLLDKTIARHIQERPRFSHKGSFGHALLIGGSFGKIGAIVLAVKGALRSGCGLVTAHIPDCGYNILQSSEPSCMTSVSGSTYITYFPEISSYDAVGIGPGMGIHTETKTQLLDFISKNNLPLVLDADALNILAEDESWKTLKPNTVLTPHPKEFDRLFGDCENSLKRIEKLKTICSTHKLFIVLKGAHTCIGTPEGKLIFNNTGNSGMAKGGSGDILTGIITALLAQKQDAETGCCLGVYLHGLTGDIAAKNLTEQGMYASDLISFIPEAWKNLVAGEPTD